MQFDGSTTNSNPLAVSSSDKQLALQTDNNAALTIKTSVIHTGEIELVAVCGRFLNALAYRLRRERRAGLPRCRHRRPAYCSSRSTRPGDPGCFHEITRRPHLVGLRLLALLVRLAVEGDLLGGTQACSDRTTGRLEGWEKATNESHHQCPLETIEKQIW